MMFLTCLLVFLLAATAAKELSDEEYASFPPHFHLDDYKRCLSQRDGLYCLGTFELMPTRQLHRILELMKEYNLNNPYSFNRTRIRRGYCVSARCPIIDPNSTSMDHSNRFERCVWKWSQKLDFRPKLQHLHYCRTHDEVKVKTPPTPEQTLFINIVYALLVMNIVGTIYDVMTGEGINRNSLLLAWSMRDNWRNLVAVNDSDPHMNDFLSVQGIRVIGMLAIIYGHSNVFSFFYYTKSPEYLEQFLNSRHGVLIVNGSIEVHMYVMLSTFFSTYTFLLIAQKKPLSLYMLPKYILKRFIRISPVAMLVLGFAATMWPNVARDGPLISYTIGVESETCRKKFWYDKSNVCLGPTWFLAADMHLYILSSIMTLIMWKRKDKAVRLYTALMFASCLTNAVVTYLNGWKTLNFISNAENLRSLYRHDESFANFYTSSWGALPSCFTGLLLAHLHYDYKQRKVDINQNKLFTYWHMTIIPFGLTWIMELGIFIRQYSSTIISSANIFMDQVALCLVMGSFLFGLFNIKGLTTRFLAWRGWQVMGKLSLVVMLIHWIIGVIIAAKPYAYHTSSFDVVIDWVAISVISYLIAVPVTIMVEFPMQKFLGNLINF